MKVIIKTVDAISAYTDAATLARCLGVSRSAVSQWGECVPEVSARGLIILKPEIPHKIKTPCITKTSDSK